MGHGNSAADCGTIRCYGGGLGGGKSWLRFTTARLNPDTRLVVSPRQFDDFLAVGVPAHRMLINEPLPVKGD